MTKKDILENDLNDKELKEASAGANNDGTHRCQVAMQCSYDENSNKCVVAVFRWINDPDFPNCAATVQDGSHCMDNDACFGINAVKYRGMHDCSKAWE